MDEDKIFLQLIEQYRSNHRKSQEHFERSSRHQIKGGSHTLRLFEPFPFYDTHCVGSRVYDLDGNAYVDFWQGHFTNLLGHNPGAVLQPLRRYFLKNQGLITGFPGIYQARLAELLLSRIGAEQIRFTTSGSLATMYAIMLAKAFTQRELVMKVGGGWHGAQPYALKGVFSFGNGLDQIESAGLSPDMESSIIVTRFNDVDDLKAKFQQYGERIACFILEPFIGAGGFLFAHKDYMQNARVLASEYGSVLILDEVISGFHFHAGGLHTLYGITPDLSVYGKSIGGGLPLAAVAGREEILGLSHPDAPPGKRVRFEGGTFSAHPTAVVAGLTFLKYLVEHEKEIYPRIGRLAEKARQGVEKEFTAHGFNVRCTGDDPSVAENSPFVGVHFLKRGINRMICPEEIWNPDLCHIDLRERIFKLAMILKGFYTIHGYGMVCNAHTEQEIEASLEAVKTIATQWRD